MFNSEEIGSGLNQFERFFKLYNLRNSDTTVVSLTEYKNLKITQLSLVEYKF